MRVVTAIAIVAVALSMALAGCSSSGETKPNSPVDPEKAESSDYVAPAVAFVIFVLAGLLVLGFVLLRRRRRQRAGLAGPGPMAPKDRTKGP